MDLENKKKNTYTVGCIVSLIFLYASKDADPTVCIIKETNKENCRLSTRGSLLGGGSWREGTRLQLMKKKSNLAIEVPSLLAL